MSSRLDEDEIKTPEWRQFEKDVGDMLALVGLDVYPGDLRGHKKIDFFAVHTGFPGTTRFVVECKFWSRRLTAHDVDLIYASYHPLLGEEADQILIVTKNGAAEGALTDVRKSPVLQHMTYDELSRRVMDFRDYTAGVIQDYEDAPISNYYIKSRALDGSSLAERVSRWMDDDEDARPMAILGSYGLGKTTFARRYARDLALIARTDPLARIPIFVRLADISGEQSLEGLLGKLFTATSPVERYSFPRFSSLNASGRFVVIFDGFDEMGHNLSWTDFKYNFQQMNRLVGGKAKVLILGRPSAFLTDFEHNYALHGLRGRDLHDLRDSDWPDYIEVQIGGFNNEDVSKFLTDFVRHLAENASTAEGREKFRVLAVSAGDILNGEFADIAQRPVQLQMIAEILPDYTGDITKLTVHSLYHLFVQKVIEREAQNPVRRRISVQDRRRFARDAALWIWETRAPRSEPLPETIVAPYMKAGDEAEAVARNLQSGSLFERDVGQGLSFAHRSFQEFLVAEAIHGRVKARDIDLLDLAFFLTPEVSSFLSGLTVSKGVADRAFYSALSELLRLYRGALPLTLLNVLTPALKSDLLNETGPWAVLLAGLACRTGDLQPKEFAVRLKPYLEKARDTDAFALILFATLLAASRFPDPLSDEAADLFAPVLDALIRTRLLGGKKTQAKGWSGFHPKDLDQFIYAIETTQANGLDCIELTALYVLLRNQISMVCFVEDWLVTPRSPGVPGRAPNLHRVANVPVLLRNKSGKLAAFKAQQLAQATRHQTRHTGTL